MRHDPARMIRTKSATNADFVGNIVHASTKALLDKQCERNDDETVRIRAWFRTGFHFRERLRGSMSLEECERRGSGEPPGDTVGFGNQVASSDFPP